VRVWCVMGSGRRREWGGAGGRGLCSPMAHAPLGGNRGGTPILVSNWISGRSQQRDDAAGGGEGRMPIVAAPMVFPAPVAIGGKCPAPPVNYWTGQLLI
jgi:hypothetical protein